MLRLGFLAVAVIGIGLRTTAMQAQSVPTIEIASGSRDTILTALRIEATRAGLSFKKRDRDRVIFEKDAGQSSVRGEFVTIVLETTVRFSNVPEGTRLTVTETINAALPTGSERRTPDPRDRWDAYMEILERTKARIEQPSAAAGDSAQ